MMLSFVFERQNLHVIRGFLAEQGFSARIQLLVKLLVKKSENCSLNFIFQVKLAFSLCQKSANFCNITTFRVSLDANVDCSILNVLYWLPF